MEDKIKKLTQNRTEEVADIIEKMPTHFGQAVTCVVIGLVVILVFFGWIIKYPDVLKGQIAITARQPPVRLVAGVSGNLILLHHQSGEHINAGDYIAYINNSANIKDVELLDSILKQTNIHQVSYQQDRHLFPENIAVGELNNKYFVFLAALYQYLDYSVQKPFEKEKDIDEKLLATQQNLSHKLTEDYVRQNIKYKTSQSLYKKDSILFSEDVLSKADIEKSVITKLNSEQSFKDIDKQITNNQYEISDAANKLQVVAIQKLAKERDMSVSLFNAYYDLQDNIRQWEHKYVFIAPFNGKIDFLNFLKSNDFVQSGQELFKVVPNQTEVMGQVILPEQGSGKVKNGQDVIIKLDNYPYEEYGSIKGIVKNISLVTNEQTISTSQNKNSAYLVDVTLPNGLSTNYGTSLNYHIEAKGTAEIITDDRRLAERLFDNLKHKVK